MATVNWFRVTDFATVQDAINAALTVDGGVVYVPHGSYSSPTTLQIPATSNVQKPLTLRGDGAGVSRLRINSSEDILNIQRSRVVVEHLSLEPESSSPTAGRGIVVGGGAAVTTDVSIRDCIVRGTAAEALSVFGTLRRMQVDRCGFAANIMEVGTPVLVRVGAMCRNLTFSDCAFEAFRGQALDLVGCRDVTFCQGRIENPSDLGTAPFLRAWDAESCHLEGVHFEEGTNAATGQWFMDLGRGCNGWTVVSCHFVRKRAVGMDGALKLVRMGSCSGSPAGPALGAVIVNPIARTTFDGDPQPGSIELRDSSSELSLIGGLVLAPNNALMPSYPVDVLDPTTKSTWIGAQPWRPPLVGSSQTLNTGRLGDLLARPARGLEMWNQRNPGRWLPASVNRYPNEAALKQLPDQSKDKGTVVWVDTPPASTSNLRVWDGTTWREVIYS